MPDPSAHNVVWYGPSHDARGSVPLGNGEIGVNAWIAPRGELVFYVGRTDAWGDNGRLLKIGRIRIVLEPAPEPNPVRQTLDLLTGTWRVQFGPYPDHARHPRLELRLWVDAHHPVVHVDIVSEAPVTATARIELWRTEPEALEALEVSDVMLDRARADGQREPTVVEPDTVLAGPEGWIGWFHRNRKSVGPALTAELQGLADFPRPDPLLHRIFGAAIFSPQGRKVDDCRLQSVEARAVSFRIPALTLHPSTPEAWRAAIEAQLAAVQRDGAAARRQAHKAWWRRFWDRSWIEASAAAPDSAAEARLVSRAYALQRYVQACAGRGTYPIKFNGSLFTVPFPGKQGDADYRRWGPGYWWQNTRLPYYNMCAAGDYDMLQPLFRMYAQDFLELWRYRTRRYFGHDGIFFSECVYFWGDVFTETYGWTPFAERADPLQESRYHKWEWVGGLELAFLMLDYYAHREDEAFLRDTILPFTEQLLAFFDGYYATNETGQWVMQPAQALETWWECTDPMPEIAGLRAVMQRLLALPEGVTSAAQRAAWQSLLRKTPALPTRTENGRRMLAPAASYALRRNVENAELYAVFPFRLLSFDSPDASLALEALRQRQFLGYYGWRQNDLFCAYLGLAESARQAVVHRAGLRNFDCQGLFDPDRAMQNHSRFPAFWGPNFDWYPDQCHGGVLNATLQAMLLQSAGRRLFLFPAWPPEWDVDFKLHAPGATTVIGSRRNGHLDLEVSPAARRADIEICRRS